LLTQWSTLFTGAKLFSSLAAALLAPNVKAGATPANVTEPATLAAFLKKARLALGGSLDAVDGARVEVGEFVLGILKGSSILVLESFKMI
jgi:hypothetical protein